MRDPSWLTAGKVNDELFSRIEETQAALREAIEKATQLASESEQLISRGRDEPVETPPPRALS